MGAAYNRRLHAEAFMARPIRDGAGDRQTESAHADLISRVVEGQESDAKAGVVDSWRRSLTQHHVEPA